jgi:hypothetical protein
VHVVVSKLVHPKAKAPITYFAEMIPDHTVDRNAYRAHASHSSLTKATRDKMDGKWRAHTDRLTPVPDDASRFTPASENETTKRRVSLISPKG